MDATASISSCFSPYLTLTGLVPGATYSYNARGSSNHPCVTLTWHQKKVGGQGQSWLYMAVKRGASLSHLVPGERLYVGSQTRDRMFRGDVARHTQNFHHADMRSEGKGDSLENYLATGEQVDILIANADTLRRAIVQDPTTMAPLIPALTAPTAPIARGKHFAYWIEQYILIEEVGQWRWNKKGADRAAIRLFRGEKHTDSAAKRST